MAGIKITDLPAAPSAELTDVFPVDQLPGPATYKESNSQLLSLFKLNGEALSTVDDTNVTLGLSGTPATALLNATTLSLGWTGLLSVPRGGTAKSSFTAFSVICGGTTSTSALQNVSGVGTANQVLVSNGAGFLPTWQSVPGLSPAALTKTDDTNVTLTLGGTPTTALLQATSLTLGWTGTLSPARGGTGVNNGTNTLTLAGNLATSGAFASTFTMTGATTVTFPTSGTLLTSAGAVTSLSGTADQITASAATGAVTLSLPSNQIITAWVAYTPTFTGFGTPSSVNIWSRRIGDTLHIRGSFVPGTTTATEARISLGYNGTNNNVTSSNTVITAIQGSGNLYLNFSSAGAYYMLIEANVQYLTMGIQAAVFAGTTKINGNVFTSGQTLTFDAEIPIASFP